MYVCDSWILPKFLLKLFVFLDFSRNYLAALKALQATNAPESKFLVFPMNCLTAGYDPSGDVH